MAFTKIYKERQRFIKFDSETYALFLNEAPAEMEVRRGRGRGRGRGGVVAERVAEVGYSYTGDARDGSTRVTVSGAVDGNLRDKFVAGLIGKRYDMDAQIAILANGNDTAEHAAELEEFARYRAGCKKAIDEMLSR